ncbi:MAG: GNAT family protein [Candidatus Omnitrophica bacterium]|nr:GNAT family protein [Candidatus Omnitrophota bacterium]
MENKVVFLKGAKVILRPLKKEDINERYLSWMNDQEVVRFMDSGIFPTTLKQLRKFYEGIVGSSSELMLAIVDKKTDLHIGNIKLGGINWIHGFAHLGVMIGDKRYWGKGYGRESCRLMLSHAFCRMNLNKVILGVCVIHDKAVRSYKKNGFKIEGRLKEMYRFNGKYFDKIMMGISRREFKLTEKYRRGER